VTGRLVPRVLEDMIKVVVDYQESTDKRRISTGKFELYYKAGYKVEKKSLHEKASLVVEGKKAI
jgi:hypothetical protein